MNGAFQFTSDRLFNAADPSTYPERLTIRVPQMVKLLSRTHSLGLYVQDKWQMTQHLTLSLGLRYDVHVSPLTEHWNPFFSRSRRVPDRQEQLPASRRVRLQPEPDVGHPRRLRDLLREAVDRPVRELLAESASSRIRSIAQFPTAQADPGPSRGRFPTDPLLVNGPTLEPGAGRTSSCRRGRWPGTRARSGWTRRTGFFR